MSAERLKLTRRDTGSYAELSLHDHRAGTGMLWIKDADKPGADEPVLTAFPLTETAIDELRRVLNRHHRAKLKAQRNA